MNTAVSDAEYKRLLETAVKELDRAYVNYSHFPVGAALLTEDGSIFGGCNIENVAFGSTMCAERTAIFSAIAAGHRRFKALLVTGKTADPIAPCGACRQVMVEWFQKDMPIYLTNVSEKSFKTDLAHLLPGSFDDLS